MYSVIKVKIMWFSGSIFLEMQHRVKKKLSRIKDGSGDFSTPSTSSLFLVFCLIKAVALSGLRK